MKKKVIYCNIFFSLLIIFFGKNSYCQTQNEFKLKKIICKTKNVYDENYLQQDKLGNIYITGYFKDTLIVGTDTLIADSSIQNASSLSARAGYCIKMDSNFNVLFTKKIAESKGWGFSIKFNSKSEAVLGIAFLDSVRLNINDSVIYSKGGYDGMLLHVDNNMNLKRAIQYGNYNGESIGPYDFDENDNLYIGGLFNQTWTNNSPGYQFAICNDTLLSDKQNYFFGKLDSNFNCLWIKQMNHGGGLQYYRGGIYGFMRYIDGPYSFTIDGLQAIYPIGSNERYYAVKFDTVSGKAQWLRTYYNLSSGVANFGTPRMSINDGQLYLSAGMYSNSANIVKFEGSTANLVGLNGSGSSDYFIGCYDTSGNFIWNTMSQSYGGESLSRIMADESGNVLGIGSLDLKLCYPNDTLSSFGDDDALAFSYDKNGNYLWSAKTGGSLIDQANDVVVTQSGKIIILASTTSPTCAFGNTIETFPGDGNYLFLASIDSLQEPFSMQSEQSIADEVEVFPNPVSNMLNIKTSLPKYQLFCYNTLGELLLQSDEKQKNLNLNHLPNGIYQIKIISDKQYLNKKIIIQH